MKESIQAAVGIRAAELMDRLGFDDKRGAAVAIKYDGRPIEHLEGDLFAAYLKKQFGGTDVEAAK